MQITRSIKRPSVHKYVLISWCVSLKEVLFLLLYNVFFKKIGTKIILSDFTRISNSTLWNTPDCNIVQTNWVCKQFAFTSLWY